MKRLIKKVPVVGAIARSIYRRWIHPPEPFASESYWIDRYQAGGNSGEGSYGRLAEFKAEVINQFVRDNDVKTVVEFGCGDGNQLKLAEYPSYIGFDISPQAVRQCRESFSGDVAKTFKLTGEYDGEMADLTLSLDVIFHLVEDDVFDRYMARLFDASTRFVIIYSSDTEENLAERAAHVRHRKFSRWVDENRPGWRLIRHVPNRYPFTGDTRTSSFADFFIYEKILVTD